MGLSSSKTTSGPSKKALPYIQTASTAVQSAYDANQPNLQNISSGLGDAFNTYKSSMGASDPTAAAAKAGLGSAFGDFQSSIGANNSAMDAIKTSLGDRFKAYTSAMGTVDPTITAAKQRLTDVLGGKLANGNPQLDAIIAMTNGDIRDAVNAQFSSSGQTGSSRQIGELAKQFANNETSLRYKNYSDEQARMDGAVGAASSLDAQQQAALNAQYQTQAGLGSNLAGINAQDAATRNSQVQTLGGLGSTISGMADSEAARKNAEYEELLKLGTTAATLPLANADFLANGLGGLWGNSTTTKSSQGLGSALAGLGGAALGGWASGGFRT